jgi:hypothetical protein
MEFVYYMELSNAKEKEIKCSGHYNVPFYPTVQTTYNYYHLFGIVNNNTPADLTFT